MYKSISAVSVFSGLLILLSAGLDNSYAYDGDVDFSAPYMTLDPETGKLITVDPTEQPVAPPSQHQSTESATDTTASISSSTATAVTETTRPQAVPSGAVIVGAVIALIAVVGAVAVKRKQRQSSGQA